VDLIWQRRIDRFLGVPLCALLSLWPRPAPRPGPLRHILVILLSEMGSLVLARPMFEGLRERHPRARIQALVFRKNREMLELLEVIDPSDILTLDDSSGGRLLRDALGVLRRLRREGVDAVIDCELFARVSALLGRLSGAPVQAGFHRHRQEGLYRGGFINRPVLYNPYVHISQQYLDLAAALEGGPGAPLVKRPIPAAPLRVTPLDFPEGEVAALFERLYRDFPGLRGRRLVLIYPGGGLLPIRAWPSKHYAALIRGLLDDGLAIGLIGLPQDRPLARDLVGASGSRHCADLTGYTRSVRELLLLFQRAALLVTNDGGPGQFAALTPVPALVFFGPETPLLYGALSERIHCLFEPLACSPCLTAYNHRNSPCDGDNQCLKRISAEEGLRWARKLLDRNIEGGGMAHAGPPVALGPPGAKGLGQAVKVGSD